MPLQKYIVKPVDISKCPITTNEANELECITNLTLANTIRQLSSLGQHAGRLFEELTETANNLNQRFQRVQKRIDSLKTSCSKLDMNTEKSTQLGEFLEMKHFKSSFNFDQQIINKNTMPKVMQILYEQAEPPPDLDLWNPYREDDAMKLYTDPSFFFNVWSSELIKDNETRRIEKKQKKSFRKNKKIQQTQNQAEQITSLTDQNFNSNLINESNETRNGNLNSTNSNEFQSDLASVVQRPAPPPPPPSFFSAEIHSKEKSSSIISPQEPLHPQANLVSKAISSPPPPPPAPPPPPSILSPPSIISNQPAYTPAKSNPNLQLNKNPRDLLFDSINKGGFNLKHVKVEESKKNLNLNNSLANNTNVSDLLDRLKDINEEEDDSSDDDDEDNDEWEN